jgi:AraC family transcriptional regulator, transcriptional activator FtrA
MSSIVEIVPNAVSPPNRLVAALLYDGLCAFELGIVVEVFGLPRPEMGQDWYRLVTVSENPRPLKAGGGIQVLAEAGLEALADAGAIVIPGWSTEGQPPSADVRQALVAAHGRGARIVSICSGAFLLAACGLLSGKRATTHWLYADALARLFPDIEVDPDVLYVDGGDVMTSAGSAAGVDLLLHIVRKDFGAQKANELARRLVMPPHRDGGQAQFIQRPVPTRPDGRLAPLLEAVRAAPREPWTISRMAAAAAMSKRTFIRKFHDATGMTPGEWVIASRTEVARHLLETSGSSLEDIALASGFTGAPALRHHFRARIGLAPAAYRNQYAGPIAHSERKPAR